MGRSRDLFDAKAARTPAPCTIVRYKRGRVHEVLELQTPTQIKRHERRSKLGARIAVPKPEKECK